MHFSSQPSHTVITKWYNNKGRRQRIYNLETSKPVTLSSPVENSTDGKCIIIRSNNLKITAYTKGKVLYEARGKDREFKGERITIIPVDEVKKGGTVFLNLVPIKYKTGAVTEPVYLMSNNEYLFLVLCREKAVIAGVFTLSAIGAAMIIFALGHRKRAGFYYLLIADLCLIILLLSGSDLFRFFIGSGAAKESLHAAMYIMLPLTLAAEIIQKFLRSSYCR